MWSRKRLDIDWGDLAYGAWRCLLPPGVWPPEQKGRPALPIADGGALACLSVRSGFDLLLDALDWPPGSEVLVSAVTIPDMVAILAAHGLRPIPIDLTPHNMSPRLDSLHRAITPATRGVLVAHLFGGRIDLEPIAETAREHGLLLIEDCAQAYRGPDDRGHPSADVSLFSFGPIKTATALGGALIRVRDVNLLDAMRASHKTWPRQSRGKFLERIAKYALLKGLSTPAAFGCLASVCRALGVDLDRLVNGSVRGFARQDLLAQIRRQPCDALAALLDRRLHNFDGARLANRAASARFILERLAGEVLFPGAEALEHTHWVLPAYASQPLRLIERLREAGFDATQGQSLSIVPPPPDRPELEPFAARETLAGIVFLPCYPELPRSALERLVQTLAEFYRHENRLDAPLGIRFAFRNASPVSAATAASNMPANQGEKASRRRKTRPGSPDM